MAQKDKQAVVWLQQALNDHLSPDQRASFEGLFQQAIGLEREQIMDAYSNGAEDEYNYQMDIQGRREDIDSEIYFNNTYGILPMNDIITAMAMHNEQLCAAYTEGFKRCKYIVLSTGIIPDASEPIPDDFDNYYEKTYGE
jgi:capsule polysaccharide modification protein KpsS